MYRLMYAQHLCYGVLVDLAKMIQNDEPISLAIPAVNLVSQRDANDVALRSLEYTANPPSILNIGGSVVSVRDVCEQLGLLLGHTPTFIEPEGETALLANDELSQEMYGPYRDSVEDLIQSVARWVQRDGTYWNKPTKFGVVNHAY